MSSVNPLHLHAQTILNSANRTDSFYRQNFQTAYEASEQSDFYYEVRGRLEAASKPDDRKIGKLLSYELLEPAMQRLKFINKMDKDGEAQRDARLFLGQLAKVLHNEATRIVNGIECLAHIECPQKAVDGSNISKPEWSRSSGSSTYTYHETGDHGSKYSVDVDEQDRIYNINYAEAGDNGLVSFAFDPDSETPTLKNLAYHPASYEMDL